MRVGKLDRLVSLTRSPQVTNDSDGYEEALSPATAWCAIEPQGPAPDGRNVETLVTMRWHPQVTMDTLFSFTDANLNRVRRFVVRGFQNLGDQNTEMRLICEEVIP